MHDKKRVTEAPFPEISEAAADFIRYFDDFFSRYDHVAPPDNFIASELTPIQRAWLDMLSAAGFFAMTLSDDLLINKPVRHETEIQAPVHS